MEKVRKDDYKVKVNGREGYDQLKCKLETALPGYMGENGICMLAVSGGLYPNEIEEAWIMTWVTVNADYVEDKIQEILADYKKA